MLGKRREVIVIPNTASVNVQKRWMPVQKVQNAKKEFAVRITSCIRAYVLEGF